MTTKKIIKGLEILEKYRNKKDEYTTSAGHEVIYAAYTDERLSDDDVRNMLELGWLQELDIEEKMTSKDYDAEEGWMAFV